MAGSVSWRICRLTTASPKAKGAIYRQLKERGHELRTVLTGQSPDDFVLREIEGAAGVLACGKISQEWINFLKELSSPVVVIGSQPYGGVPTVRYDWGKATELLLEHLFGQGHRYIGLVNGEPDYLSRPGD